MLSNPKHRTPALLCFALILLFTFTFSARPQTPTAPTVTPTPVLEFEVATIKAVDPHASMIMVGSDVHPGGIVELNGLSLKAMITVAFDLKYWQVEGGEPWMEKDRYNVVGEPPEAIRKSRPDTRHTWYTIADPRLREMLQTLLIQRFQLKSHRTTQTGKVYFLERTSRPLTLQSTKAELPPESPDSAPQSRAASIGWAGAWNLYDTNMTELADFISSTRLHRPVLDHTGLSGAFDYRNPPDDPQASMTDRDDSLLQMLHDVGLKLQPSIGPTEILTIDHAEPPTPN